MVILLFILWRNEPNTQFFFNLHSIWGNNPQLFVPPHAIITPNHLILLASLFNFLIIQMAHVMH